MTCVEERLEGSTLNELLTGRAPRTTPGGAIHLPVITDFWSDCDSFLVGGRRGS